MLCIQNSRLLAKVVVTVGVLEEYECSACDYRRLQRRKKQLKRIIEKINALILNYCYGGYSTLWSITLDDNGSVLTHCVDYECPGVKI